MTRKLLLITFLLTFTGFTAVAQQKTDFSGTWKLNIAKSDFGPLPAPVSRTDVVTHKDTALSDKVTQESAEGKQEYTAKYTIDGKEAVNMIGTREVKTSVKWAGNALSMSSRFLFNDTDVVGENNWTLSADGKTLTMSIHYTSAIGDADQTFVYEKQDTTASPPAKTP
jgi:hypothetical protein